MMYLLSFARVLLRDLDLQYLENFLNSLQGNTKYDALAVAAAVVFACICIRWVYTKRSSCNQREALHAFTRSMSLATLHGGKMVLESLINYQRALGDEASVKDAQVQLQALLKSERPDFNKLQAAVMKLEMSEKEAAAAAKTLGKELQKAQKEGKSHEAYEIGMLLVEMLIYKGELQEALNCECLKHEEISDARRPLYKAIIYAMLDNRNEAKKNWEEFKNIQIHFQHPPGSLQSRVRPTVTSFKEFEKLVKGLKSGTQNA